MRKLLIWLVCLGAIVLVAGLFLTRPAYVSEAEIEGLKADPSHGEYIFHAAGCASCHAASDSEGDDRLVLKGGKAFETQFGTFYAPNISSDPVHGIGAWSDLDIVTAVMKGTSPEGQHYYPAFPYAAYGKAEVSDILSLAAFLKTLPADPTPSKPHDVGFPFSIRSSLGGWKMLFVSNEFSVSLNGDDSLARGQYLTEALSHCGECHTPRNALGGIATASWLGGAPNPSGKGKVPNITPGALDWSETDITYYLQTGFTPDFDSAGGSMADVVTSLANLTPDDAAAIAAYLKAVPTVPE
jgi:mono/diheme cytochrome c family protein